MSSQPLLTPRTDVSERELVETGLSFDSSPNGIDGEEDEPRDDPDGEEDPDHHLEVSQEDVGVGSILVKDVFRI